MNGSFTVQASDANGDNVSITWNTVPSFLNTNGFTISGTGLNANVGSFPVSATLSDGNGGSTPVSFDWVITNVAPVFTSSPSTSAVTGTLYSYTPTVDEGTISAITVPSWLNWNGSVLSGTPNETNVGNHNVSLSVNDGHGGLVSQNWTITVASGNVAPTWNNTVAQVTVAEDLNGSFTVQASDANGDVVTVNWTNVPSFLSTNSFTISGTGLNANVGSFPVSATLSDGNGGSTPVSFDWVITNVAPSFLNSPDTIASIGSLYTFTAIVDEGTVIPVTRPIWLSWSVTTRTLSGTPTVSGQFPVRLVVNDGHSGLDTLAWTISVPSDNNAPTITSLSTPSIGFLTRSYNGSYVVNDVDGDPLTVSVVSSLGNTYTAQNGSIAGQPSVLGTDQLTLSVTDGLSLADSSWIVVVHENHNPLDDSLFVAPVTINYRDADSTNIDMFIFPLKSWTSGLSLTASVYHGDDSIHTSSVTFSNGNLNVEISRGNFDLTTGFPFYQFLLRFQITENGNTTVFNTTKAIGVDLSLSGIRNITGIPIDAFEVGQEITFTVITGIQSKSILKKGTYVFEEKVVNPSPNDTSVHSYLLTYEHLGEDSLAEMTLEIFATVNQQNSKITILFQLVDSTTVGISESDLINIPTEYELSQNYPNPFNPSTKISYALPYESYIKIDVYNIVGEKVKELVNYVQTSGYYEVSFDTGSLSSGIYFYSITANSVDGKESSGGFRSVKKMILLK